jgi:hypothetical protein
LKDVIETSLFAAPSHLIVVIPAAFNSAAGQAGIHFDFAVSPWPSIKDEHGSRLSPG